MKPLSVQAINNISPYEVSEIGTNCYQFFTEHGVHCSVEFVYDDSLMSRDDNGQSQSHKSHEFLLTTDLHGSTRIRENP